MSKLTKRLSTVAGLVAGEVVCDVGCDHGKLGKYLLDSDKVKYVYVSDISALSLKKAVDLLQEYPDKFKAICCDGLTGYSGLNVDECIISGMGGYEIMKIIDNSPIDIGTYILSPQHNEIELKQFLLAHGYNIIYDIIISDKGKFYNVLKAKRCHEKRNLTQFDLMFGKTNFKSPDSDIKAYIEYNLQKLYLRRDEHGNVDNNLIKLFLKAKKECEKL